MENTEFLSNDRLKISPRAYALALQNNVDILKIVPSGPEGRIIENDILRAIEERNQPKAEEKPEVIEEPILPISDEEELVKATDEGIAAENKTLEEAEKEPECAEEAITEETAEENAEHEPESTTEVEETTESETEPAAEETDAENAENVSEETAIEEEPTEAVAEENAEENAPKEEPAETAIVTAPVTAVSTEEKAEEPKEKAEPTEKAFRSEDAYRHTDVIISQSENAPENTPITMEMSFDATAIITLRGKIKETGEAMGLPSVTINDMILFAVSKTLKKHKAMNAHFLEDKIRYFDGIHLGFTVDTERGPQTLTVFDADRLSLSSLSKITGALVRGVRAGGDVPEKNLRLGSFTVNNVGTLGIERFTPVLTAPQTASLAVCALCKRIKDIEGDELVYPCIPLALTFDPRAMTTANAAKFLRDLCTALENFGLLLIK